MDVFDLRRKLVNSYADYIRSFIQIRDARIDAKVKEAEMRTTAVMLKHIPLKELGEIRI